VVFLVWNVDPLSILPQINPRMAGYEDKTFPHIEVVKLHLEPTQAHVPASYWEYTCLWLWGAHLCCIHCTIIYARESYCKYLIHQYHSEPAGTTKTLSWWPSKGRISSCPLFSYFAIPVEPQWIMSNLCPNSPFMHHSSCVIRCGERRSKWATRYFHCGQCSKCGV